MERFVFLFLFWNLGTSSAAGAAYDGCVECADCSTRQNGEPDAETRHCTKETNTTIDSGKGPSFSSGSIMADDADDGGQINVHVTPQRNRISKFNILAKLKRPEDGSHLQE